MKHLLNDLSNEEKNRIREQYEGGMLVDNSRFKKLMESKLGNVKPLIMEQNTDMTITLPSDAPLKITKGGYKKDDTRLTLFNMSEDGTSKFEDIYSFLIQDHPEFANIPNTVMSRYSKDIKTWEQDPSNPQQITLHSENKFLTSK